MVHLDRDAYQKTKNIVLGIEQASTLAIDLAVWLSQRYAVKMLNFQFDRLKIPGPSRYRLYLILAGTDDYQKMFSDPPIQYNPQYQAEIAAEFSRMALKHRFTHESNLENLFVAFNDFSVEAKTAANNRAYEEVSQHIRRTFPAVWGILLMGTGIVVFYFTDGAMHENEANGVSPMILDDYYSLLKGYDELNYFTRQNIYIKFDS